MYGEPLHEARYGVHVTICGGGKRSEKDPFADLFQPIPKLTIKYTFVDGSPHLTCTWCDRLYKAFDNVLGRSKGSDQIGRTVPTSTYSQCTTKWITQEIVVGRLRPDTKYSWHKEDQIQQYHDRNVPAVHTEPGCPDCYDTLSYIAGKYKHTGTFTELSNGITVYGDIVFYDLKRKGS